MMRNAVAGLAGAFALTLLPVSFAAEAATETVVYSFCAQPRCADGKFPGSGLIDVKGTLYGTLLGAHGKVYAFDPASGTETVLHSFRKTGGGGFNPSFGSLIEANGTLYGTTLDGGVSCPLYGTCGTLYALDRGTGKATTLYAFQGGTGDGGWPQGSVVLVNGMLYGTTYAAGANNVGTVFSFDLATGTETTLHNFAGPDGADPAAGLINVNGVLYGTTAEGGGTGCGGSGCGTVFSIDPATGSEAVLHAFQDNGQDGTGPWWSVLANVNGTLYGTTLSGGGTDCSGGGCGTVFSVDSTTGSETVLHAFQDDGTDGQKPAGGVISVNGTLFGTTIDGGNTGCEGGGCGIAYSLDPASGTETVLHDFGSSGDGAFPAGPLINAKGTLYGTTGVGGAYNYGTVFSLVP